LRPGESGAHGGADELSVFVAALEVFHFTGAAGVDPLLEAGALFSALGGSGRGNGGDSTQSEACFAGERIDEGLGEEHSIRLTQPERGMRVRESGGKEPSLDVDFRTMKPGASRISIVLPSILLFLLCASAAESASGQIVGRWRSLETSEGGIGAMYEFHANGTVDYSPGAVVEMPWRIENDDLVLPPATVGGPVQKKTLKWLSENKVQFVEGDSSEELTRSGDRSDAGNPIIGEWMGTREMDGRKLEMHWFFYPAGKGLFLLPFLSQHGRYTTSNSTLRIEMPDTSPVDFNFQVKGDVLTLAKLKGSGESRFARY